MKNFLTIIALVFVSMTSQAQLTYHQTPDVPLLDYFKWQLKPAVGYGAMVMDNDPQTYVNLKVYTARFGEENAGVRFLGVGGVVYKNTTRWSFSPVAINCDNWLLSIDIQKNRADGVGASLNYSF